MSARHRINAAVINGSLIVATLVGVVFKSWTAFLVVLVVLIVGAFHTGDIRPTGRRR